MRIRRRPPGQPLAYLPPSDPLAAPHQPAPPRDHREGDGKQQGEGELHLHPAPNDSAADLGAARSSSPPRRGPALPPQDDGAVEVERSTGLQGAQQQQQQQGPADGRHSSLENGLQRHVAVTKTAATTGGAKKATTKKQPETKKDSTSGGGVKRAPSGSLVEGSRCSRKNGRGWRCSQPTKVGYALCQYHLGKGRLKSGSAAGGGHRPGKVGSTEHAKKKTSAAAATAAATAAPAPAAPMADVPPPAPSVQQC